MTILVFEEPIYELQNKIENLKKKSKLTDKIKSDINALEKKLDSLRKEIYANLSPWEIVQVARHPERPYFLDYVNALFTNFVEIHGDRHYKDDNALVCGTAEIDGEAVMLIGQQKGRDIEENMKRNFGMPNPEGYRKALRVMKLAEKFNLPIITFIDTPGAYPGMGAEERGQAEAIAVNLREMAAMKVPIISVVIGEGGSGGALGIGVANVVLMLENAIYSVISPEGCASILWRDASKAPDAAEALKITSKYLYKFGIIDKIVPEPLGGAHQDLKITANNLKKDIKSYLKRLKRMSPDSLKKARYNKFRKLGEYIENKKIKTSKR